LLSESFPVGKDAQKESLGLRVRRHTSIAGDGVRTSVVSGDGEGDLSVKAFQKLPKVADAAVNVLGRVERVGDAEAFCRFGHQLHHAHRPLRRTGEGIEVALRFRNGEGKGGVNAMPLRRLDNEALNVKGRRRRDDGRRVGRLTIRQVGRQRNEWFGGLTSRQFVKGRGGQVGKGHRFCQCRSEVGKERRDGSA
jgi:hypothetical protein